MSRAAEKQERLTVWLRMRKHLPAVKRKSDDDDCDDDIDIGREEDEPDRWLFDLLPPELLLHLLQFLDSNGLKNMVDLYPRARPLIAAHPRLRLYFYSKRRLLTTAARDNAVREFIVKSRSIRESLQMTFSFYRNIADFQVGLRRRKAKVSFYFGAESTVERVDFLLSYATKRLSYNKTSIVVVVASTLEELNEMHDALVFHNLACVKMPVYDETISARIAAAKKRIFILVNRLTMDFPIKSMRTVILFRPLMSHYALWAIQTLDPEELVVYVRSQLYSQMFFVAHSLKDLEFHSSPLTVGNQLWLSRKKYLQIEQDGLPGNMKIM